MQPLGGGDISGAYLTAVEARELGAVTAGSAITTLLAKDDTELATLLLAASWDLDHAMTYQGVRYEADQAREFPRYKRQLGTPDLRQPREQLTGSVGVWDWDSSTNTAIVPERVKLACLHQAASLLDTNFRGRLDAIRSGLASQSIGSLSETYLKPADIPGGLSGLSDLAQRLMDYYRARSGGLL